jgi:hypothetical protein
LTFTNILDIILNIFNIGSPSENNNELHRYLKLEAIWILINLSYGDDDDLEMIFSHNNSQLNNFNTILMNMFN